MLPAQQSCVSSALICAASSHKPQLTSALAQGLCALRSGLTSVHRTQQSALRRTHQQQQQLCVYVPMLTPCSMRELGLNFCKPCEALESVLAWHAGSGQLRIRLEKADVAHYRKAVERPLFHVSLLDAAGKPVEASLVTPPCTFSDGIIRSDHTISLRTKAGDIPEGALSAEHLPRFLPKDAARMGVHKMQKASRICNACTASACACPNRHALPFSS